MKIQGCHFLVTGANRGIGYAVAAMAAQEKAHLHLVMRKNHPELATEMLNLGAASVKIWQADLSSRSDIERLLQELASQPIDMLFNNAGVLAAGLLETQTMDEVYEMLQVNTMSHIHLTHGILPGMLQRGRGKIINNASAAAFINFPCATTYSASKAAILAFTNCLHEELRPTNVTTLCLITPRVNTRMLVESNKKFSKNFTRPPADAIPPEKYAQIIKAAILSDAPYVYPWGITAFHLWLARSFPSVFSRIIRQYFHR